MSVSGSAARLTLPYLAKDDEGLYTLRIFTKDGTAEHSAYLFVSGRTQMNQESPGAQPDLNLSVPSHPSPSLITITLQLLVLTYQQ